MERYKQEDLDMLEMDIDEFLSMLGYDQDEQMTWSKFNKKRGVISLWVKGKRNPEWYKALGLDFYPPSDGGHNKHKG
jgi:hypothetical protein